MANPYTHPDGWEHLIEKLARASYHYADDTTDEWNSASNLVSWVVTEMADNDWSLWDVNRFWRAAKDAGHEFLVDREEVHDRLVGEYIARIRRHRLEASGG